MKVWITSLLVSLTCLTACFATEKVSDVACGTPPKDRAYFTKPTLEITMDETLVNIVKCFEDETAARARAVNIGVNAPVEVQDILTALYRNAAPDAQALQNLGQGQLDMLLHPTKDNYTHTTMLNEAVRQANYRWTRALLEAGADPNASGSIMAYSASDEEIFDPRSRWTHMFQDGTPAVPFLQAYLEFGGVLDTTAEGGFGNGSLISAPFNNQAARIFLLEQGADPWLNARSVKRRSFHSSFMGGLIFGALSSTTNEEMYALIQRGLFVMPRESLYIPMVHDHYLETLEELKDASGPALRHNLWTLQRVINALIQINAFEPSARMQTLLDANPIPDSEGGWIRPEGQLHQNYDDARVGAVLGTEIW